MSQVEAVKKTIRSTVPARLDRLSWSPSHTPLFIGYLIGAGIMMIGGLVEIAFGINAEGKSLEEITKPLTAADTSSPSQAEPALSAT